MKMRFATRAFIWSFVPFALMLASGFWFVQQRVQSTVREGLHTSLVDAHISMDRVRAQSELQNSRLLRIVGENPSLKAGLQLVLSEPKSKAARLTLEDQLREIAETLRFDLLLISDSDNRPLAGVLRVDDQLVTLNLDRWKPPQKGFFAFGGVNYQLNSFPIDANQENVGVLSIGERFDLTQFTTPTVLAQNGKVLSANVPNGSPAEVETALRKCGVQPECETKIAGETYLTLVSDSTQFGDGYVLRSLQSVDSVSGPVHSVLQHVFLVASFFALLIAAAISLFSSRSIVHPIAALMGRLRESEATGLLPDFETDSATIHEIRELTETFNRAANSIREGRDNLQQAYLEFTGSLANTLDARDNYTAGHSRRVSEYSCVIAQAMYIGGSDLEVIRIGALLHDIGKIGIIDSVLRKPAKLTREEIVLLQQHPSIGRRILEGVRGFQPYLPIVELHHENWDGTGYPLNLSDETVPLCARIVHVADAYDAMTSARPYRGALSHETAIQELVRCAGTQFDPAIIRIVTSPEVMAKLNRHSRSASASSRVISVMKSADSEGSERRAI
jgi:HD-GYP domain-containing protein (c-di-GMP phosphodiesterase class II)